MAGNDEDVIPYAHTHTIYQSIKRSPNIDTRAPRSEEHKQRAKECRSEPAVIRPEWAHRANIHWFPRAQWDRKSQNKCQASIVWLIPWRQRNRRLFAGRLAKIDRASILIHIIFELAKLNFDSNTWFGSLSAGTFFSLVYSKSIPLLLDHISQCRPLTGISKQQSQRQA